MKIVAALALVVVAFLAAGSAHAAWCGESSDAACDSSVAYVECADGTIWLVDPTLMDADVFGETACMGSYTVLAPPSPPAPADPEQDEPSGPYDLDPNMAPDPSEYVGEVVCPDGTIWAVARGDHFACPP